MIVFHPRHLLLAVATLVALALILPNVALAKHGSKYRGSVNVESRYSNGSAVAQTRGHGTRKQVRGPGGTWVSCFGGCDNAYREEFLDFWETIRENAD